MGTVLLGMDEREFWRCTPRKLLALWGIYRRVHGLEKQEEKVQMGYIDQVL
ncbi:hypothetical protein ABEV55_12210 [Aneurinibacillus thermoaerophilus]|uniref:hypothetical protein n=1 Tax=Aneurinibacillus thermoaerophilus TaxID=143495 RepID=UPI002E1D5714|nr:hypothetical protein [Aneurinibacillus thermoaerophilus]